MTLRALTRPLPTALLLAGLALAGCHASHDTMPGDSDDHHPWQGIAAEEHVRATGTEPFWSVTVTDTGLRYATPDKPDGVAVAVSRFAGRGGLSFSGEMDGAPLTLAITPGACSDGMSDRRFPFVATLRIGEATQKGCGWTDRQPFTAAN